VKSILGPLSVKRTRSKKKKIKTLILPDGYLCRIRLVPWIPVEDRYVWLVSLAVSKSNRQINDWMNKRKNRRTRLLSQKMTGKVGPLVQSFAVNQLRKWVDEHPEGDSITFKCESVEAEKQFRIWKLYFARKCNPKWTVIEEDLAFYFYKYKTLKYK